MGKDMTIVEPVPTEIRRVLFQILGEEAQCDGRERDAGEIGHEERQIFWVGEKAGEPTTARTGDDAASAGFSTIKSARGAEVKKNISERRAKESYE